MLNSFVLDCVWEINDELFKKSVISSGPFGFQDQDFFRARLIPVSEHFKVDFFSFQLERIGFKINQVSYSLSTRPLLATETSMRRIVTPNDIFQKYSVVEENFDEEKLPEETFSITFHLKLETVENFGPRLIDLKWTDQLWQVAKTGQFTDVDFIVGEETFRAHRFIVSARSRVMAAMFNTDMVEAKTGRVVISNDVDGATFQHFLNFLYTGQPENNAVLRNKQLYTLADQYQVSTLKDLCQSAQDATEKFTVQAFLQNIFSF